MDPHAGCCPGRAGPQSASAARQHRHPASTGAALLLYPVSPDLVVRKNRSRCSYISIVEEKCAQEANQELYRGGHELVEPVMHLKWVTKEHR